MRKISEAINEFKSNEEMKIQWKKDTEGYYGVTSENKFFFLWPQLQKFLNKVRLKDSSIEKIYVGNKDTLVTITIESKVVNFVGGDIDYLMNAGLTRITANGSNTDYVFAVSQAK